MIKGELKMSKQIDINPFSITVGVISLLSATVLSCGITDIITHNSLKKKFRNDVLEEQVRLLNSNSSTINKGVSSLNNDNRENQPEYIILYLIRTTLH